MSLADVVERFYVPRHCTTRQPSRSTDLRVVGADSFDSVVADKDTELTRLRAEVEREKRARSELQSELVKAHGETHQRDVTIARLEAERLRWIVQLLKARYEFAKGDHNAAYHELYQIASPDFTKLEPWAEFEQEVAALSAPTGKGEA
jgi:hypothetical protein